MNSKFEKWVTRIGFVAADSWRITGNTDISTTEGGFSPYCRRYTQKCQSVFVRRWNACLPVAQISIFADSLSGQSKSARFR